MILTIWYDNNTVFYFIFYTFCQEYKHNVYNGFLFFLTFTDLDVRYFWRWSVFEDYLLFCFGFTMLCAFLTLLFLDWAVFVESLGSLAVLFEAMLGLPQLLQNYNNGSTRGMRSDNPLWSCQFCEVAWSYLITV